MEVLKVAGSLWGPRGEASGLVLGGGEGYGESVSQPFPPVSVWVFGGVTQRLLGFFQRELLCVWLGNPCIHGRREVPEPPVGHLGDKSKIKQLFFFFF